MTDRTVDDASSINRRAILAMTGGMSLLACNDALVRWVGADLPVGQIMTIRGLALLLVFVAVFRARGMPITLKAIGHKWSVARALCELTATYLFLTAIMLVPIAIATTLVFTAPIIMTAIAGPVYGEKVGVWRWTAVIIGFLGVMLITTPVNGEFDPALFLALGCSALVVLRDIVTRRIDPDLPSSSIAITTTVVVALGGLLSLPWGWHSPSPANLAMLTVAGLFVGGSYILYVTSVRIGDFSLISPFRYIAILWAALFGWLIWDEAPGPFALAGCGLIIGSGLLILYRERVNRISRN
ncbi:MAG: DMT family transporter [Alphaproteobacteria bacterium]